MKVNSLSKKEQTRYLTNTYGVNKIKLTEQIQHNCPLGEQVGVTTYTMTIIPGKTLAELVQLHWDIQKMVGKTFTLESGLAEVLEILKKHYKDAKKIEVIASCPTNRHMACEAYLEYENVNRKFDTIK